NMSSCRRGKEAPPETPPSLGDFTIMVASLGGYLNRKCDGPPGTKTMWVGLQRMVDFALAWKSFGPKQLGIGERKRCV
ncbi:MAG: hypothetical protein NUV74_06105, partial [Candidatus Brocadiaceae bacterium]|nr:hypothetical protein [Candidatus Brocadiaceae bacterium]